MTTTSGTYNLSVAALGAGGGAQYLGEVGTSSCPTGAVYPTYTEQDGFEVVLDDAGVSATVWRRGDVVMALTRTARSAQSSASPSPTPTVFGPVLPEQVSDRVVSVAEVDNVVRSAIEGVCASPSTGVSEDEVARSPYLGKYEGLFDTVKMRPPRAPVGLTRPAPPEFPEPTWVDRAPLTAFAQLAPVLPGLPGDPPDLSLAARGPAPVLVDPAALGPAPSPVTYPEPPSVPQYNVAVPSTVQVQVVDEVGPGCGWRFSNTVPATFSAADAAQALAPAQAKYYASAAAARTAWIAQVLSFPAKVTAWQEPALAWANYSAYTAAVEEATRKLEEATQAYEDSVRVWQESIQPLPTPTPTPAPTPTRTPAPSEAP